MSFKEFCRVLRLEASAIESAVTRFESSPEFQNTLNQALDLILSHTNRGGKVLVLGLGKSGKIAAKIAATLASTGTPALYIHPTEALHGDLGVLSQNDLAIALSQTGNTEEVVSLIPFFNKKGIPLISLTGNPESKLAKGSKLVLNTFVSEEACSHNLAPTASTTLALAMGDALALCLMKARGFTADDFAMNHPGGALGRRLGLQVLDLMHPLHKSPIATETASMDQILTLSTQYKLGAVLIVESKKLIGVVTDGDIRRALSHREKFFRMTAAEIMTRSPICAKPTLLAYDALRMMEERESQISVLPVINDEGDALGLLRIHDLVQTF